MSNSSKCWRIARRLLATIVVLITLIVAFFTEEFWRGKSAWEKRKHDVEAHGFSLEWTNYMPPPVPAEQNVFGVPEMQRWFSGHGSSELSKLFIYPTNGRIVIAKIELTNVAVPGAVEWGDPQAKIEAERLIKSALGPTATAPAGFAIMKREASEIEPARIVLHCQTAPSEKELMAFLPLPVANTILPDHEGIKIEPQGNGVYRVSMEAPISVSQFLKANEALEPSFAIIRQALERPGVEIPGDYSIPFEAPIPNFVTFRVFSQWLVADAKCRLLLGQPDKALDDLRLIDKSCRILVQNKPLTLVAAMINVAVRGLYAQAICDGENMQGWQEPQYAALEAYLKPMNLIPSVCEAFQSERVGVTGLIETEMIMRVKIHPFDAGARSHQTFWGTVLGKLMRGWLYQNLVTVDEAYADLQASCAGSETSLDPGKIDLVAKNVFRRFAHWSPTTYLAKIAIPNFGRGWRTTAQNQSLINEARIACALERYRLAHSEYPETLGALVPQFIDAIPDDPIGGQPLHYRTTTDGKFLLYSVGWNQTDDGGFSNSDWVWPIAH